MLKCDVRRFERDGSTRARANVIGEGPALAAEDFVARFELSGRCRIFADRFDRSRKINAYSCVLWFAQPDAHCAHDLGRAFDEVPVIGIDRRRANSDQDLIVIRNGLFNLLKLKIG